MNRFLRSLAECRLLAQRSFDVRHVRADDVLKPFLLVAIALLLWPEYFTMVELTTLLDLLGATLFVLAFATGLKLLGIAALARLKGLLVPPEYSLLLATRGRPPAAAFGLTLYVVGHVAFFVLVSWASLHLVAALTQLVA